jgi:hypothetical protein
VWVSQVAALTAERDAALAARVVAQWEAEAALLAADGERDAHEAERAAHRATDRAWTASMAVQRHALGVARDRAIAQRDEARLALARQPRAGRRGAR